MIGKVLGKIKKLVSGKGQPNALDNFISALDTEIKEFRTVFDVGAYHGNFISQVLDLNPGLTVHVFEPFNDSFQLIQNKFKSNPNIKVNHAAVSEVSGLAQLNVNSFKETNSLLESSSVDGAIDLLTQNQSTESVVVVNLDEYCKENRIEFIDLIKIDTQGNSYNVLKGFEFFLRNKRVKYLYVEAEFVEIYKNEKLFSEIELLMREYGYSIVNLYNLNYINKKKLGWCDVLFSPKN